MLKRKIQELSVPGCAKKLLSFRPLKNGNSNYYEYIKDRCSD